MPETVAAYRSFWQMRQEWRDRSTGTPSLDLDLGLLGVCRMCIVLGGEYLRHALHERDAANDVRLSHDDLAPNPSWSGDERPADERALRVRFVACGCNLRPG